MPDAEPKTYAAFSAEAYAAAKESVRMHNSHGQGQTQQAKGVMEVSGVSGASGMETIEKRMNRRTAMKHATAPPGSVLSNVAKLLSPTAAAAATIIAEKRNGMVLPPTTKVGAKRLSLTNATSSVSNSNSGESSASNSRCGSVVQSRRTSISSISHSRSSSIRQSRELSSNEVHVINKPAKTFVPSELNRAKSMEDEFIITVPAFDVELLNQAATEFENASQKIATTLGEILTKYGIKYTAEATVKTVCTELSIAHSRQLKIYADQLSVLQNALQQAVTTVSTMTTAHAEQVYNIRNTEAERLRRLRREQKSMCEKVKRETEEGLKKVWEEGQPERERANQRLIDERVRAIVADRERDRKEREEAETIRKADLQAKLDEERQQAERNKEEDNRKRREREEEREAKLKSAAALCKEMERKWKEEKDSASQLNVRLNSIQRQHEDDREEIKKLRERLSVREQSSKEERDQFMEKVQGATADATNHKRELFKLRNQLKETEDALHNSQEKHKTEFDTISRKLKVIVEKKDKQIEALQGHNGDLANRVHVLEEYIQSHKQELQALQTM